MMILKTFITLYFIFASVMILLGSFRQSKPEKYVSIVTGVCMILSLVFMW